MHRKTTIHRLGHRHGHRLELTARILSLVAATAALAAAATPARATTIQVPSQYATIQSGIDHAASGDTVVVAAGTYAEDLNIPNRVLTVRAADLRYKPVLTGGGSRRVQFSDGCAPTTVLKGFIITKGDATQGGGMRIYSGSPTIADCEFVGNHATAGGGVYTGNSAALFTDCRFHVNTGTVGAGVYANGASIFKRCVFTGNFATSAGAAFVTGGPHFDECTFVGNSGVSTATVECGSGGLRLTNCLLNSNGGFSGLTGSASGLTEIINCTLVGMQATYLFQFSGPATVSNSILWGNASNSVALTQTGSLVISYSNVQGGAVGLLNMNADPQFADPSGLDQTPGTEDDDFRLRRTSPCIDAGNNNWIEPAVIADLAGWPRIVNHPQASDCPNPGNCDLKAVVDLGAYEFSACDPYGEIKMSVLDTDGDGVLNDCDGCPNDPQKFDPGFCGCGKAEKDTDGDGVPDCVDDCPEAGDTDGDGVEDCEDGCPNDPNKLDPGSCGCGVADVDGNGDGVPDCLSIDLCPNDPNKTNPGACGCGTADKDEDGDGVPDCYSVDLCPSDPNKTNPGACGCGTADVDANTDGIPDCFKLKPAAQQGVTDACTNNDQSPPQTDPGPTNDGSGDEDTDEDEHETPPTEGGPANQTEPTDQGGGPPCGIGLMTPVFLGAMPLMWARRSMRTRRLRQSPGRAAGR